MKKLAITYFTLLLLVSTNIIGQNKKNLAQPELESGTIEEQFDYIINKSTAFKDFQLIRKTSILKVKAHALDSIRTIKKDLINANQSVAKIQGTITQLENEVKTLNNEVETISKEIDSISFFGTLIKKSAYSTILWSLILVLLIGLIIFIALFNKSNAITKRSKNEIDKLENDFETFRKNSLKKEQETMRKLQDEINKNNP